MDRKRSLTECDQKAVDEVTADLHRSPSKKQRPPPIEVDLCSEGNDSFTAMGADFFAELDEDAVKITQPDPFLQLPEDIIQNIFAGLPMRDLLFIVNRVSTQFHGIVASDKFLEWKKLYFRYRYEHRVPSAGTEISELLSTERLKSCEKFFVNSIIFIHKRFRKSFLPAQRKEMLRKLKRHRLIDAARNWLDSQVFPQLKQTPSLWAELATVILLSTDALEIGDLIRSLTLPGSEISSGDVFECLYCLCLLMLAAYRFLKISPRYHYNLYSAIYFLENAGFPSDGQLEASAVKLTPEQARIVHYPLQPNDCLKIIAFAGTGKTATLVEYVRYWPDIRFLVLMFNKKAADEACARFPRNAMCLTTHSWALRSPCYVYDPEESRRKFEAASSQGDQRNNRKRGYSLTSRASCAFDSDGNFRRRAGQTIIPLIEHPHFSMKLHAGSLRATDVNKVVGCPKGFQFFALARYVIETLQNFFTADSRSIQDEHIPECDSKLNKDGIKPKIDLYKRPIILKEARNYWARMRDFDDFDVKITHDGYLKLFQLEYRLPEMDGRDQALCEEYDVVLVDEAQDMNPVTFDVIKRLVAPKIFVGDPHQQIYAFRGAVDALNLVESTKTFHLTRSFRFGSEIGFFADSWLEKLSKVEGNMLIGSELPSSHNAPPEISGKTKEPVCIICRYNGTLYDYCVKVAGKKEFHKIHIIGQNDKFKWNDLRQIYALTLTEEERMKQGLNFDPNKGLLKFGSLMKLKEYATNHLDVELAFQIKIVESHQSNVLEHISRIEARTVPTMSDADYILTTAHQAKGLQFDHVLLADDFALPGSVVRRGSASPTNEQTNEYNLVYVAMTRAKKSLQINRSLFKLKTEWVSDPMEQMITFSDAMEKRPLIVSAISEERASQLAPDQLPCRNCPVHFKLDPNEFLLYQPNIHGSWHLQQGGEETQVETAAAVFCPRCSAQLPGLRTLFHPRGNNFNTETLHGVYESHGISRELQNADWTRLARQTFLADPQIKVNADSGQNPV